MSHTISPKGIDLIKKFESCRLNAYQNPGDRPTIGWGSTSYENGKPVKLGEKISKERADSLFLFTLTFYVKDVNDLVKSTINQNQFDALVSFTYNLGKSNLSSSTLLKKVNLNPNDPTIKLEFAKWISKGTIFENGLRKRRLLESQTYFS